MASPAEKIAFVQAKMDPDLAYILNDIGVSVDIQHGLATEGYTSARRLAAIEDTAPAARAAFKQTLSLDSDARGGDRLALALMVDAWNICRVTAEKDIQARAEARVHGAASQMLVSTTDHSAMRRAVERPRDTTGSTFYLPEDEVPATQFLTDKLTEVEQNDPQATPLDEIVNIEVKTDIDFTPVFDRGGALRTVRKRAKVDTPATPEAYRKRMRIEANLWLMVASKCRNKQWLVGLREQTFTDFVDHILGRKVDRIDTADPPRPKPAWSLVLSYEYVLRKEAFKRVRRGTVTLDEALQQVLIDTELRNMHFIEPLVSCPKAHAPSLDVPSTKRPRLDADWPAEEWAQPPQSSKGKGKGKKGAGKGKDKSRGKDGPPARKINPELHLVMKTPDGRDICFLYNKGQCQGGCGRVHCCRVKGCTHNGPARGHPHA